MRHVLCLLLALSNLFTAMAVDAPAPATQLLTDAERKEFDAVVTAVFAAGFPDTAKSTVYFGKATVSATFDPSKTPPPLPSSLSSMQATMPDSRMKYVYTVNGLHFKLADGSWVLDMLYHFTPKGTDSVALEENSEVKLNELTALAVAKHKFSAEKDAAKWVEALAPEYRARATTEMNKFVPVTQFLQLETDEFVPAILLLYRAGWADAADASISLADQRARNYWLLKPWTKPDTSFDPTLEYKYAKTDSEAWAKANPTFTPEPPAVAFRRGISRWCRAQLTRDEPEDALMPPAISAAVTKATLDPDDPQKNIARIDATLAGMKLPVTPPENADLATRLQSWERRIRQPRMVVTNPTKANGGGASISTSFQAATPAYEPQPTDLDALVALLADERPSRFWDFNGPCTLGDNAWRAVAILLKADPRTLAGYPTDKPWTSAERKSAAEAVQKWWKENRQKYVKK